MPEKTDFQMVKQFCEKFGHISADAPQRPPEAVHKLRMRLMLEEMQEVIDSMTVSGQFKIVEIMKNNIFIARQMIDFIPEESLANFSMESLAKELADLLYVVHGTAAAFGIDMDRVFEEVHLSNMSKLDENGSPIYNEDGKVMKSENYTAPDMSIIWYKSEETVQ